MITTAPRTDTALRLNKYFGNSSEFWLGLEDDYDLAIYLLI